jgi:hypothetical protein
MKSPRYILINCAAAFVAILVVACGGGGGSDTGGSGTLSLTITDAPVLDEDVAEVWVRFTRVIIHPSGGGENIDEPVTDGTNPWIDINLKDLTEGKTLLLGEFDLAAGQYSWIRLDIDPENTRIVERTVVGEPDGEGNTETDDVHYTARRLDCSSCDESHLKLNRSFTIENAGWINFTVDFDLQKSLTLQLPQSAKPRPDDAYKLRPTLRILEAELASTYIWGSVTDTRAAPVDPADPTGCRIYTYTGDMASVVPDDICVPVDEFDTSCDGVNNQRPLDTAMIVNNGGSFDYRTGSLYPGTYTVAMLCPYVADDPDIDDGLTFIGEQEVDATLTPPDGLGVEANFLLSD